MVVWSKVYNTHFPYLADFIFCSMVICIQDLWRLNNEMHRQKRSQGNKCQEIIL